MARYRLSARVDLSPAAEKLYLSAKNKSEFIRQAIEFYAQFGKPIYDDLQEIKRLLYDLREKAVIPTAYSSDNFNKQAQEENEMSDEEKRLQQSIMSTLDVFLRGGTE